MHGEIFFLSIMLSIIWSYDSLFILSETHGEYFTYTVVVINRSKQGCLEI